MLSESVCALTHNPDIDDYWQSIHLPRCCTLLKGPLSAETPFANLVVLSSKMRLDVVAQSVVSAVHCDCEVLQARSEEDG